jgi:hypothetical protein
MDIKRTAKVMMYASALLCIWGASFTIAALYKGDWSLAVIDGFVAVIGLICLKINYGIAYKAPRPPRPPRYDF